MFWIIANILALVALFYMLDIFGLVNYYSLIADRIRPGKERAEDIYLLEKEDLENMRESFDERAHDLTVREENISEKESDIQTREAALAEERERIEAAWAQYEASQQDDMKAQAIVTDLATKLGNMPPEDSLAILEEHAANGEDQLVIDVLLEMDRQADAAGRQSLTPYLISLMPPDMAARILEKYRARAEDLN
jgi:hypothetical protein